MKYDFKKHLLPDTVSVRTCLSKFDELAIDAVLFVLNEKGQLLGSLTDGDIRRGLIENLTLDSEIKLFIEEKPKYIKKNQYDLEQIINLRERGLKLVPVLDNLGKVVNIINFRYLKSYLPIDVVIMAGGFGKRLKPLTDKTPKPLLPVGGKAIIDHNIGRLLKFGIDDFWISIRYLGEQVISHLGNGNDLGVRINYVREKEPLGTIGSVSLIPKFENDYVLITNSDVLTNLDYERFFLDFKKSNADFAVATVEYDIEVPYAILETDNDRVSSFKEKPTYVHYANAGIYLMKKEICDLIPKNKFFNATDLLQKLINEGYKVVPFHIMGYWLDIGKHEDYAKAQKDIEFINFD